MPGPNLTHLLNNPNELLDWFATNLVIPDSNINTHDPDTLRFVDFTETGQQAHLIDGQKIGVFVLRASPDESHDAIPAYICNYTNETTNPALLADEANFCFTPTLDGCTFGVGPSMEDFTRTVWHSNHPITEERADDLGIAYDDYDSIHLAQSERQRSGIEAQLNDEFGLDDLQLLEPSRYRNRETSLITYPQDLYMQDQRATVFGIRTAHGWEFFYQRYSKIVSMENFSNFYVMEYVTRLA